MVDVLRSSIVLKRRAKAPAPAWCEVYSTYYMAMKAAAEPPLVFLPLSLAKFGSWKNSFRVWTCNDNPCYFTYYYYCCYSLQEISCTVLLLQNIYTVITTITNSDNCKTTIVYILSVTRVCFVSVMKWLFVGNCRKKLLLINTTSY